MTPSTQPDIIFCPPYTGRYTRCFDCQDRFIFPLTLKMTVTERALFLVQTQDYEVSGNQLRYQGRVIAVCANQQADLAYWTEKLREPTNLAFQLHASPSGGYEYRTLFDALHDNLDAHTPLDWQYPTLQKNRTSHNVRLRVIPEAVQALSLTSRILLEGKGDYIQIRAPEPEEGK